MKNWIYKFIHEKFKTHSIVFNRVTHTYTTFAKKAEVMNHLAHIVKKIIYYIYSDDGKSKLTPFFFPSTFTSVKLIPP